MERLRAGFSRRAAGAVLVIFALLIVHNVAIAVRNQLELPHDDVNEMDDWFDVSSRDLEHVASRNPRFTVNGRIAIYYFLERRLGGKTLTVPPWWNWAVWELEHVSRANVEISPIAPMVDGFHARRLRRGGEERVFQKGSRKRKRLVQFYFVRDPLATRYVLVESMHTPEIFVISEERYHAIVTDGYRGP
jgi:hypothetical protein